MKEKNSLNSLAHGEIMKNKILTLLPHDYAPFFRVLHITVGLLVLSQIINSNFTEREALNEYNIVSLVTWFHIISGFMLIFLGLTLLVWMLTQRGFRWYFAWMALDFRGIKDDLLQIVRLKLPKAAKGGIAATIQGLGVVSLLLVAVSGGMWFMANSLLGLPAETTRYYLHWHKFLTTFIEIYFYAHGIMGLLHILLSWED